MFTEEDKAILQYKNDTGRAQALGDWIKTFPNKALKWQGKHEETLFHWAAITSLGNLKLLTELDPEGLFVTDMYGNTPMDWVINRLGIYVVMEEGNVSDDGKLFILNQSNEIATFLYDHQVPSKFDVVDWLSKSGSILFTKHLYRKEGVNSLLKIGENEKTILHNWLLLGERLQKHQLLVEILETFPDLNIDSPDKFNRTALYYAIDGWIFKPDQSLFFEQAIKALLRNGANPFFVSSIEEVQEHYEIEQERMEKDISRLAQYNLKPTETNGKLSVFKLAAYNKMIYEKFILLIETNERMKTDLKFKEKVLQKEYQIYESQLPSFYAPTKKKAKNKKK